MPEKKQFRVFATSRIGDPAENRLRERGYELEVFEGGKGTLKVVAQIAVGFDNINRTDANKYKIPFTHTADVLTEATAEFAFLLLGMSARKMNASARLVREQRWPSWHPFLPFLG